MHQQRQRTRKRKGKKKGQEISLITLLANTRTAQTRKLLEKYGKEDATCFEDLELKLAELYRDSDDKIQLEKELAEMHPHRSFILKNLAPDPTPEEPKEISNADGLEETPTTPEEANSKNKSFIDGPDQPVYSNCAGKSNCNCNCNPGYSNACGCSSGFDGKQSGNTPGQPFKVSDTALVLGVLGIVAITGMVIYAKRS
jgi:hypothetical protein